MIRLPIIELTARGLPSINEAVWTLFHKVCHQQYLVQMLYVGAEPEAEAYGARMLAIFLLRTGG